ncbi:MAG: CPBP family intramembrane metalloprotease [Balneolaceae bacterium]|nr:CPBP family intramembrane metalloprotease [Balneolaceae bacterium]
MKIANPDYRHKEILYYFLCTYLFSWAFWIPSALMFAGAESIGQLITSPLFIALQTLGAAGPSIVAYFFLKYYHGKDAIRSITDRYKVWRLEIKWYAVSIFLIIFISLLSLLIHIVFMESPLTEGHALFDMYQSMGFFLILILPVIFFAQLFSSPLLEEFGWRGYAQPLLQKKYSVLSSSIIIGLVWGVWHLPLILTYGHDIAVALMLIICHSILIGWVLNSTKGSMLMVLIFHASINVGVNILSPGHDDIVMLCLTLVVTLFVVYKFAYNKLIPFNLEGVFSKD